MADHEEHVPQQSDDDGLLEGKAVSRREFLKIAGIAGAVVGVGGGLSGVLAACGSGTTTTSASSATTASTAAESTTTTAAATTSSSAPAESTTSTSAAATSGRDIKLGLVSPTTGALASFAIADNWWVDYAMKAVPDGIVGGDGQKHKIVIVKKDNQSDSNRAAQVAGDLINNDKVDLLMSSGSPDTVNPVADQAEAGQTPSISNFVPWQPFFFGRNQGTDKTFKYTYAHAIGLEDIVGNFLSIWNQISTNKKVGFLFANDADGVAWTDMKTGLPPAVKAAGYEYFLSDLYPVPTEDFTKYISDFKKNGCEIVCGTIISPDFSNFWKQAVQQGLKPKVLTIGKALLFPQTLDAIGPIAYNATVEWVWSPTWPFKDSITGATCQQLADDFMAKTGGEWTAPIAQYAKFEWAVDIYKRATDLENKDTVVDAIQKTKLDTCLGPIDFSSPISFADPAADKHPNLNVYKVPAGGGQWVKGTKFPFEIVGVANANNPELPVAAKVQEMQYS
jgi:branched-chain amino acid transport system substrate-binding protein